MTQPPLTLAGWLRHDIVMELIPPDVHTVLEIGCGQGGLGARLAARFDYLGIEPDPDSYAVAAERLRALGRGRVLDVDVAELVPESDGADLVCAFEVLEHLPDDREQLIRWRERIRPGGWLLVTVPADQSRFGPADHLVGHVRRYDTDGLRQLLVEAGYEVVRISRYGAPLAYALEAVRHPLARRRLGRAPRSVRERTSSSGRLWQPAGRALAVVTRATSAPFRWLQHRYPGRGPWLIALSRRSSRPHVVPAGGV
jgi:SAM-dependent methyltransferase